MRVHVRELRDEDIQPISAGFTALGWHAPPERYASYLDEQRGGLRPVFVALIDGEVAGFVTVLWTARYAPFVEAGIPEVADFNVLPRFRRRGVGTALMDRAEECIRERSRVAGLGVGMYADYGPAQRLYAVRGYLPDARGLHSHGEPVVEGGTTTVDDDLVLYLTKQL